MTMPSERDPMNAGRTRRGPFAVIAAIVLLLVAAGIVYLVFFSNAEDGPVIGSTDAGAVSTDVAPSTP